MARRVVRPRRVHSANYIGALLWLLIAGGLTVVIARHTALFAVSEDRIAYAVTPDGSWRASHARVEVHRAGAFEDVRSRTCIVLPASGEVKAQFRVAVSGNLTNTIGLGILRGQPPFVASGSLTLSGPPELFKSLIERQGDPHFEKVLLSPLEASIKTHRELRNDREQLAARVSDELRAALPPGHDQALSALVIESVIEDTSGESSITSAATKLEPNPNPPLAAYFSAALWTVTPLAILTLTFFVFPQAFIALTGIVMLPFILIGKAFGGDFDLPFDFDVPDIDIGG